MVQFRRLEQELPASYDVVCVKKTERRRCDGM